MRAQVSFEFLLTTLIFFVFVLLLISSMLKSISNVGFASNTLFNDRRIESIVLSYDAFQVNYGTGSAITFDSNVSMICVKGRCFFESFNIENVDAIDNPFIYNGV